jgi:ABC-type sugar transport system ATPase subunit
MKPILVCDEIEKAFFGVPVLKRVSFTLGEGRVLGLVGENGAGKSTLMNILGGNLQPDAGRMLYRGAPYKPRNPQAALAAGIGFVHQELNLFPNLTIAENLFLSGFPTRGPFIRRSSTEERARAVLERVGLGLPPSTLVERLTPGERQLVEVARALAFDARLIILDEPTTSLSTREAERLFDIVRQLRSEGRSVIYISHALGDVLRLCDDLMVLRDGAVVGQGPVTEFDRARLVSLMVGRELTQLYPTRARWSQANGPAAGVTPVLAVRGLSQPGIIRDISFTLQPGEVLGIFGLMGAGRTELARILFGLDPAAAGTIEVFGQPIAGGPAQRIQRGMAFVTESRREDGLCLEASVADNMALVALPKLARGPLRWIDRVRLRSALANVRDAVRLQARVSEAQPVQTLSGGNQQKVVLAKWLLTAPRVLILDEPTRGVDVGAKFEIYSLIHTLADQGAGVLMISSEMEELTGTCDRILVMCEGRITDDIPRAAFDAERILRAALPG